jgi:PIN domain nuclease of toxin-antitoxin system
VKLLLDTCALIWLMTAERALPDLVRAALLRSDVLVSAVSAWEIAIKYSKGALHLREAPDLLVPSARARYGFGSLPIDEESALHVRKLQPLHADPFDRMLVSQAIVHGLTIVTPDPLVTQYPARTLWGPA